MNRAAFIAMVLAIAAIAASAACGLVPGTDKTKTDVAIPVRRGKLSVSVPANGYLEAVHASPIAVPRVPTGALKVKQLAEEGSIVAEGDMVVRFDDTELNLDLQNQVASFRSTGRQIDQNSLQSTIEAGGIDVMRRVAELERDNAEVFGDLDETIFSRQEVLEAEVRKETAEETIVFADAKIVLRGEYYDIEERILDVEREQVQGKIERVETSLGQLVLNAPIGGLVLYKKNWRGAAVAVGDTIWPGNVILSIVDPTRTSLSAFLLEKDAAGVEKGAEAIVVVDARPDREFHGTVSMVAELSRSVERGSPVKYTEVKIDITDGDPQLLKPGMKAQARINVGTLENAVYLPRSAVRGEGDATWVLLANSSGAVRQPIKLGLGDQVRVSVDEGLRGGERVLLGDAPGERAPQRESDGATVPSSAGG